MRGVDLTPGQKQRIAIARVILKNAPILLLDEASSSIESESSRVVQEALDTLVMGNKTTILIAHRAAMMRHVDNIVVLNGGRIVESGSHDSLVAKNGLMSGGGLHVARTGTMKLKLALGTDSHRKEETVAGIDV
ncbi:ABC transporter B family member 20-like [Arachis ipaensis]|uniref:ABC transporter B family member 20-like n=1 Tax=Arachis ipaensis TaxID=130454 RepID=UPI0007AF7DFF|nr:ABC transporter B family member 20-like [Arachis ipaensis]